MEEHGLITTPNSITKSKYSYDNIQAFKFAKGDVISSQVSIKDSKIIFKKKAEVFEVPFSTIPGD
jgi:hypothetical protein